MIDHKFYPEWSRFFIKEIDDSRAYFQAKIVFFDDETEEESTALRQLAKSGIKLLKKLNSITGAEWDETISEESDVKTISFLISGNDGFTLSEKQQLLEMTSTSKRIRNGVEGLKKAIQRVRLTHKIQKIIKGNGDVKKLLAN